MSIDEQMAAIGRLVTERADTKREQALMEGKIRDLAEKLQTVGSSFRYNLGSSNQQRATPVLDDLITAGGLDSFKALLADYYAVTERLAIIEARLKAANVA